MRISMQNIPPGGWHYPQAGAPKPIQGNGFEHLVQEVTNWRISNGVVLGNPSEDIQDYICDKFPQLCFRGSGEPHIQQTHPKTFRERVTSWAANRYQYAGKVNLVEQDEADQRAQVCAQCPANQNWRVGCPPCIENTDRTLLLIRQNRKPSLNVLGCSIAGHDNTTAAMLPEEMLRHRTQHMDKLPDFCWMRNLATTIT